MEIAACDFRFGWRWLLPLQDDDRVALAGFGGDDQAYWRCIVAPKNVFTDSFAEANVWIVNSDRADFELDEFMQDFSRVNVVCVVGLHKAVSNWRQPISRHFPVLREYALLPAGNPRVIIPLDSPQHAEMALRLHRPGRYSARMFLLMMRGLAFIGQYGFLRRRMLCIGVRDESCLPKGAVTAGLAIRQPEIRGAFALYLGTPDLNRKTVILPVTDSPKVVLKSAASPDARQALHNELSTLRALAFSPLAHNVPAVLDVVECEDTLTLYQEYRPRRFVKQNRYHEAIVDFLARLSAQDRRSQPLASILSEMGSECGAGQSSSGRGAHNALMRRLKKAATEGVMLWAHRSHGDFAPWNCSWTMEGLFVFDWEESRECAPAFGDAFYFVVAPAVHVSGRPDSARVAREALGLATEVVAKTGLPVEDVRIYWALWLLERVAKSNDTLYGRFLKDLEGQWQ